MERGYFKVWRKIKDSQSYNRSALHRAILLTVFVDANWKGGFFCGRQVAPGQIATSVTGLAEELREVVAFGLLLRLALGILPRDLLLRGSVLRVRIHDCRNADTDRYRTQFAARMSEVEIPNAVSQRVSGRERFLAIPSRQNNGELLSAIAQ